MEQSLEYQLPLRRPRAWTRVAPALTTGEGPKWAFRLLLFFLIVLYSNITVIYKSLEAFRPAALMGFAAIVMMAVEIGQSGRRFQLAWPQGILLLGFLALAFVSSFDAMWAKLAFQQTSDLSKIVLIYIVLENTVTSESRVRTLFLTMVCCGLIPALGIINNYVHGVYVEGTRAAWRGIFANPNEAAYGLLILLPLAWTLAGKSGWLMRLFLFAAMAISLVAIFLTFSRGGLLGLFAVIVMTCWKQKSMIMRVTIIAGLVGAMSIGAMYWKRDAGFKDVTKDTTVNQRIATIKAGLKMFEARPVLGVGPGCSIVAYPLYVPRDAHCGCADQLVIHNSFVQVLSELGLLGFLAFMGFLGMSMLDAWKMQKKETAVTPYATALEIALWGYVACSLSGGFTYTWWPYILIGIVVALKHISTSQSSKGLNAAIV